MRKSSPAFQAMQRALLRQLAAIPAGKVVGLDQMALAMNVHSRHIAYLVSRLSEAEGDLVPWHRLVPSGGRFPAPAKRSDRQTLQLRYLAEEGLGEPEALSAHMIPPAFDYSNIFWADDTV
jgi:methylated-DNA-protein-cysteine methyltransferase-like protein